MIDKKELTVYVGEYIRKAREEAHLTQQALADLTDISMQQISCIERGIKLPGTMSLLYLIIALHIDIDALFEPYLSQVKTDPEQYEKFCELGKHIDEEAMNHVLYMLGKLQSK